MKLLLLIVQIQACKLRFFENVHKGLCYGTDGLGWGQGIIMFLGLANMVDNPILISLSCLHIFSLLLISSHSNLVLMCSYLFSSRFFPSHLFLSLLTSSHCNLIFFLHCVFSLLLVSSHSNLALMSSHLFLLKSSSYVFSSFLISFCLFSCRLLWSHLFPLLLISFSCLVISFECLLIGLEQRRRER